jgi:hypothetical protein
MFKFRNYSFTIVVASGLLAFHLSAISAEQTTKQTPDKLDLRQKIDRIQQDYQLQIDNLKKRLDETEKTAPQASAATAGSSLNIGLSGLFAAGWSSVDNAELAKLQAGGHDPKVNGFTIQNVELTLGATVDNSFDAQANIVFQIDSAGATVAELEEAYFVSRSLPGGLQLKGGQYFTEFGRQNNQHPHTWAFVDQPVILARLFGGDGLRSQGIRASWLLPTESYSELTFGIQNAKGETATSFLNAAGEDIGGHTLIDRQARGAKDLLYSARWLNGVDLSDTLSMNLGLSALLGPNASSTDTNTRIAGADLYFKWQPNNSQRGYPFVAWHTEVMQREYEAGDQTSPGHETLKDRGMFTHAVWGFKLGWEAGLRWEYATADGNTSNDPLRDTRKRLSPNLTWRFSEYSKVRLQYNRDWAEHLPQKTANSVWLQYEFGLGSHMAHTF